MKAKAIIETSHIFFPEYCLYLSSKFKLLISNQVRMLLDDRIQINGISYQVCGEIGEGGVGHVFVVRDKQDQRFALKIVKEYGRNPIIKELTNREVKVQSQFKGDPHIIQIIAFKVQSKRMFIVCELGTCSLRNIMAMEGHIQLKEFLKIAVDSCNGLMAIHSQNIIHRDIKPENIICVEKTYKITDFGSLQEGLTSDEIIGTPLYLPPQLLEQGSKYDQRLDIWSLGVTLFEVYFKIRPFYYSKEKMPLSEVYQQLKENIKCLTPNFTVEKLLTHLQKKKTHTLHCESIRSKLLITPKEILEQFEYFFKDINERPEIEYFVAVFKSFLDKLQKAGVKQCKILKKLEEMPLEIQSCILTLNTFYDLTSKYGLKNVNQVEYYLQECVKYWSKDLEQNKYLEFCQPHQVSLQSNQEANKLWKQIQDTLYRYWLYLNTNKELTFFQELSILQLRVLLCGARFKIGASLSKFLKIISSKLDRNIKSMEELEDLLTSMQAVELRRIADTLIHQYYLK